jgi:hypothetical protein
VKYELGVAMYDVNNYIVNVIGCGVTKHGQHAHAYYKNEFNMKNLN